MTHLRRKVGTSLPLLALSASVGKIVAILASGSSSEAQDRADTSKGAASVAPFIYER
jgi:hypothetical protein